MTAGEAITFLSKIPPDVRICLLSGSEYFEIEGFELKSALQGSQKSWLYSRVEWPKDYERSDVVKIIRRAK